MHNEEIDKILDDINHGKFSSEIAEILDGLHQDKDLIQAVEKIFEHSVELNEIQSLLIIVLKKHVTALLKEKDKPNIDIDEKQIADDIATFTRRIIEEKFKTSKLREDLNDMELDGVKLDKTDKYQFLTGQAREDYKRVLKQFAIYEAYKFLTPNAVAGESKRQNYINNMIRGGEKFASQHEGGREEDLKGYSSSFIKKVHGATRSIKRDKGPSLDF